MSERNPDTVGIFRKSRIIRGFWFTLYDMMLPFAEIATRCVSLGNKKLKVTLKERTRGIEGWKIGKPVDRPGVLIHAASFGEYEGVRPLIEKLLEKNIRVAVSYSSPSAQRVVEQTPGLWAYGFLPLDYLHQLLKLFGRLDPGIILIAKHDFWPNTIRAATALGIPVALINANFHTRSRRNLPVIRSFHKSFMRHLSYVLPVSDADARRVEPLLNVKTRLRVLGDTRYDRVRQRAETGERNFKSLKEALSSSRVFVAGSTWQADERIIWRVFKNLTKLHNDIKLVIAPHELSDENLDRNLKKTTENQLSCQLFSRWNGEQIEADVIILDQMGILAGVYTVGWAAYVGGGFGRGVHSVIEPAAFGIPVAFGSNYHVSHEARLLIEAGGGFKVESAEELEQLWGEWLDNESSYQQAARSAGRIVSENEGATERLMDLILPMIEQ